MQLRMLYICLIHALRLSPCTCLLPVACSAGLHVRPINWSLHMRDTLPWVSPTATILHRYAMPRRGHCPAALVSALRAHSLHPWRHIAPLISPRRFVIYAMPRRWHCPAALVSALRARSPRPWWHIAPLISPRRFVTCALPRRCYSGSELSVCNRKPAHPSSPKRGFEIIQRYLGRCKAIADSNLERVGDTPLW